MDNVRSFHRLEFAIRLAFATMILLATTLPAQTPPPPPLMLGTAWYPEQWPESRWDADLTLMQQAGIRMVRVGEFAWSRMEPSEGQFDFDWLDRAVAAASKHGIYTVVGTPTAAPPAWLTQKYPETLRVDEEGHRLEHGNRQQFNFANGNIANWRARLPNNWPSVSATIPGCWAGKLITSIPTSRSIPTPRHNSSNGSRRVTARSTV